PNNFALGGDGLNTAFFRWNAPAVTLQDLYTFKIDHVVSSKHNLSLRGSYGRLDRIGDTINAVYAPYPGGVTRSRLEDQAGFEFRSTPLNQVLGANEISLNFSSAQTGVGGAQVNLPQLFGDPAGASPIPSADRTTAGDLFNLMTGRIGATAADFYATSEDA